jgi:hypothetical protein
MSLEEKYSRVSNTYSYSIQCNEGDDDFDDVGSFRITIPPFPFRENQASQVGIFTLESFYITGQTEADYVGQANGGAPADSDYDISGFYVEINGIGLRPQMLTSFTGDAGIKSVKMFPVINEYGSRRKADDESHLSSRVTSGGYCNKEVICSNPSGSVLHVKVYSMDSGNKLTSTTLDAIINFKIEMLPTEISNGM